MAKTALIDGQITGIIARELRAHADQVMPAASLRGDLHADSLDIMCLVVVIEDELGVQISDAQTSSLYDGTVGDVLRVVEKVRPR
ncbi:acyl carrier protein [Sphingomonas sp. Leaf4]|uniref:acyl carrier protein n=1 Tax=Sphingomonas sp. Leaf4 TaxID=2876553 RepID=UPI001E4B268C|nr:acyl carrier protein [Sphingomonas sp. Leaf4]